MSESDITDLANEGNPIPTEKQETGGLLPADQVLPPNLFLLPVNSPIVFPTMLAPLLISLPRHIAMVEEVINRERTIGLVLVKGSEVTEELKGDDLYTVGIAAKIIKRLKLPDGSISVLVHSLRRFKIKRLLSDHPYLVAESEYLDDVVQKTNEMDALTRSVVSQVKRLSEVNPFFTEEMRLAMINAPGPGVIADLVAFALALPKSEAQSFLETIDVKARFEKLILHLRREQDLADLQKKIHEDVNNKLSKMQREFFLKEQLKTIKKELGVEEDGKDKSTRTFRERIEAAGMPEDAKKSALEELQKFETLSESSPEYNIVRSYLEMICSLPWSEETVDNLDLRHARQILDDDHYGLEKVKERIIEFLSVRKLKADPKGSIICLVGPPGVGKTSVGKSIAKTLGRSFFRFSLGGMRDEAEIKGHRRTYIGAMPGKILQGMRRAGKRNCVLLLDEIDKLGNSYQGDPSSALLEVLDPEQNSQFLDHYLDIPFDLSKVLFITTANSTASIPAPLLDRMEVIELPGYTLEEKEDIAIKYVIPRELEANGVKPNRLRIERAALRKIMTDYAREPGLRVLQQLIGKIARKAAAKIVTQSETLPAPALAQEGKVTKGAIVVRAEDLVEWLGPQRYINDMAERIAAPGVSVGLAWTAMGGDILYIEATDLPGTGVLKLTGQMGNVMSESANIAWSYVKKRVVKDLGYDPTKFKESDIHLHIPAGAIPKDGPSAGVTMATSLYSLFSGRRFRNRLAMTGELSLVGKVLPVGGIKEKLLAAKRSGITDIIMPEQNRKDLVDVPKFALDSLKLHFVSHIDQVFDLALESTPRILKTHRVKAPVKTQVKSRIKNGKAPRAERGKLQAKVKTATRSH